MPFLDRQDVADPVIMIDSNDTALQDVAATEAVYERAFASGRGRRLSLHGA